MNLLKSQLKERVFNLISSKQTIYIRHRFHTENTKFTLNSKPLPLAYNVVGESTKEQDANPIVIMHGLFGSKQNWKSCSKAIYATVKPTRQIYLLDARNHGESPHSPDHSYIDLAEDIAEFHRQHKISKSIVIGHSMGGRAMMIFALNYPEMIEKAVICDISASPKLRSDGSVYALREAIKEIKNLKLSTDLTLGACRKLADKALMKAFESKTLRDFILLNLYKDQDGNFAWRLNFDALADNFDSNIVDFPNPKKLRFFGPLLFMAGTQSDYIKEEDIPIMKETFPNCRIEYIDAGHLLHIENPKEFLRVLLDFINKE